MLSPAAVHFSAVISVEFSRFLKCIHSLPDSLSGYSLPKIAGSVKDIHPTPSARMRAGSPPSDRQRGRACRNAARSAASGRTVLQNHEALRVQGSQAVSCQLSSVICHMSCGLAAYGANRPKSKKSFQNTLIFNVICGKILPYRMGTSEQSACGGEIFRQSEQSSRA